MNSIYELMIKLILSEFNKSVDIPDAIDENELKQIYALSTKHDLAHIVASALEKRNLLTTENAKNAFTKQKMIAIYHNPHHTSIKHMPSSKKNNKDSKGTKYCPYNSGYLPAEIMLKQCCIIQSITINHNRNTKQ